MKARTHTLASRAAQHFCCLEAVKLDNAHRRIAERSCRIYSNTTHAAVVPHLRPEPLTYLLTKLGTYTAPVPAPPLSQPSTSPSHPTRPRKYTFCTRTARQHEHDHSHFTSWEKKHRGSGVGGVGGRGGDSKGHRLSASKNVTWHVGTSPSHLNFLQPTFACD